VRGIPNNPVICRSCRQFNGAPKDQLCHSCRITNRPNLNKRFSWTPEFDQQLRLAYQESRTRIELTGRLDAFQRRSGFTRVVVLARATQLGLSSPSRLWTQGEMDSLGDLAGTQSKSSIARRLGRSYWAVKAQCAKHNISARVTSGYSRADLEYLLGVGSRSVRKWIQLGWLKIQQDRINEPGMIKFLREHPEEYRLNRVDETWFKGLLFPSLGRNYIPATNDRRRQSSSNAAA